jgi:Mrp family chromosome partitioning ATPase
MTKLRAALRRWFWLLVVGTLIGALAGAASLGLRPERDPDYQATSVVLFDLNRSSSAAQEAAQQAGLRVQRGAVPLRAAQLLGENDPEALLDAIVVEVDGESLSLIIRAVSPDQEQAVAVADAFTTAFLETSNEQELQNLDNQIQLLERQVSAAEQRLAAFDVENPLVATLTDPNVPLVRERATLLEEVTQLTQDLDDTRQQRESTTGPYSRLGTPTVAVASAGVLALPSSPVVRIVLLAALGFGLAAMLIALVERWNPRIDSKDEAEESTGLPVLSMVPYLGRRRRPRTELVDPAHFGGGHAESYRRLRSAVQFVSGKPPRDDPEGAPRAQSFLIVSASPGEGKTSTVAFTSFALAEADVPTLAINADSRRPTLHRRLGVQAEPGLTDLAEYRVDRPHIDDVVQPGPIDDLWVLPSGHAGPLTTEMVQAVAEAIQVATARGATVVIDSSPLLATADVMELIPLVDHVVYVIRNGRTTRREALEGLEMLRLRDAPLLGCVCVGSRATKRRYSYYENYYYRSSAVPRRGDGAGPAEPTPQAERGAHGTQGTAAPGVGAGVGVGVASSSQPPPYRAPDLPGQA